MVPCPKCNGYNVTNDPSISDIILGSHECKQCGERFEMAPVFRWLEAEKLSDRLESLERRILALELLER